MKINRVLGIAFLSILCNSGISQTAHFTKSGSIDFVKTANMFALIQKDISGENENFLQQAFDAYKKNQPQFKKLKSKLTFSGSKTLFVPEAVETVSGGFFDNNPLAAQNNTIYSDLSSQKYISEKNVFEEKFLVSDSIKKIKWKITDENRKIAGYTCRRANGIIMDSIYVVAFYTDQIPVSGGPESFSGLPGMILGVALPHENLNWFAVKVNDYPLAVNELSPPKKGKAVNITQLKSTLKEVMKNWGNGARSRLKGFML